MPLVVMIFLSALSLLMKMRQLPDTLSIQDECVDDFDLMGAALPGGSQRPVINPIRTMRQDPPTLPHQYP